MKRDSLYRFILLILFAGSAVLHGLTFNRLFIGHHDFLNGHIAMTVSLWRKEGISKTNFAPVYSVNSDIPVRPGFGVLGRDGRSYYVSYPPFVFYLGYIFSFIPFLRLEQAIKLCSIFVFIACFSMIYMYLRSRFERLIVLTGMAFFSFLPISAYFLGNVLFVDIAMLPFWFLSFLVFLRLTVQKNNILFYYGFFLLIFLITLTEWFGILLALSVSIFVLFFGGKFGWSRKYRFSFIINTLLSVFFALLLTVLIFVGRIDAGVLGEFLYNKFLFRSNISSIHDYESLGRFLSVYWEKFYFHINLGFGNAFKYILTAMTILSILSGRLGVKLAGRKETAVVIVFFGIAPLLHYIFLNQFHYWHDFGNLYSFFLAIIMTVWGTKVLFAIIQRLAGFRAVPLKALISIILVLSAVMTSFKGYTSYFRDWLWISPFHPSIYSSMKALTGEHDLILTNHDYNPLNWYYYQRNVIGPLVGEQAVLYVPSGTGIKNVYYMSDTEQNTIQSCGGRKTEYQKGIYYCKIK